MWLLGPGLARPILAHAHARCLERCRRLEWQVLTRPMMQARNQQEAVIDAKVAWGEIVASEGRWR